MSAGDPLIVALDLPDVGQAEAMAERLSDRIGTFKIGYELAFAGGLALGRRLVEAGKRVFFDLKLHDIPNTVERGVAQIAGTGATFLTVHAYPQTLAAAAKGAAGSPLVILGVTILTSMDDADCARAGYGLGVVDLVRRRARQTYEAGCGGLVCAPTDIGAVRETVGAGLTLVTPGVRPSWSESGDQKRIMTPAEAMAAGADMLVIGRPITRAADPAEAVARIRAEMAATSGT